MSAFTSSTATPTLGLDIETDSVVMLGLSLKLRWQHALRIPRMQTGTPQKA